jgi:hypothetical protein
MLLFSIGLQTKEFSILTMLTRSLLKNARSEILKSTLVGSSRRFSKTPLARTGEYSRMSTTEKQLKRISISLSPVLLQSHKNSTLNQASQMQLA